MTETSNATGDSKVYSPKWVLEVVAAENVGNRSRCKDVRAFHRTLQAVPPSKPQAWHGKPPASGTAAP